MAELQHPTYSPKATGEYDGLLRTSLYPTPADSCQCCLFQELHSFRKRVEEGRNGLHHYPYTTNKNKIFLYQTAFFGLSSLFAIFLYYLYFSSFSWVCTILFGSDTKVRIVACIFCSAMFACSLVAALLLKPEVEIMNEAVRKARKKARKIYLRRRLLAASCAHNSNPRGCHSESATQKSLYHVIVEKIERYKEDSRMTLKRIGISKRLDDEEKEFLYNQAILELQYKLESLISLYEENRVSYI